MKLNTCVECEIEFIHSVQLLLNKFIQSCRGSIHPIMRKKRGVKGNMHPYFGSLNAHMQLNHNT